MSHFSAEQWLDAARGAVTPELSAIMERHLDEGCGECRKLYGMWEEVLRLGRRESTCEPPEWAVRSAKSAYASGMLGKWLPRSARAAQLIFDSFRQPAVATVRGATSSSRQLLHKAEPFVIDLRLERVPAQKLTHLMGQVLNSEKPEERIEGIEIFALSGERVTAKTTTSAFGEFDLELGDEEDLQLFVRIRGQKAIGIVLPRSTGDERGSPAGAP